jgi:hypothetical protein
MAMLKTNDPLAVEFADSPITLLMDNTRYQWRSASVVDRSLPQILREEVMQAIY